MQSDEMHAAVAKLLKNELPRPEWRCAVHQGCTGQRFFASEQGRTGQKKTLLGWGGAGQGQKRLVK